MLFHDTWKNRADFRRVDLGGWAVFSPAGTKPAGVLAEKAIDPYGIRQEIGRPLASVEPTCRETASSSSSSSSSSP